jgi:hypothetical protein
MNDEIYELMRREADAAPAGDGGDLRRGRIRLRRRRAAIGTGGTGLAAVALVAGSVALPSAIEPADPGPTSGDRPTIATTREADGTVTVTFDRFNDLEQVEPRLEELGIPTEADFGPLDKECAQPRFRHAEGAGAVVGGGFADPDATHDVGHEAPFYVTVDPDRLQPDQTVVIQAGYVSSEPPDEVGRAMWAAISVADGPVRPCVLVDDEDNAPPAAAYYNTEAAKRLGHE